ncbi:hypothetical protein [Streptomyces sp. GZWMJZ-114]|uniref:hypothetical protein n=1 Tax=Streptomyces sp. GZWMJZ-114 TaxID=2494734 RepID=UPI00101294AE|nr:hypothetical protein [Streptomyces sp. GZWMJZ-114]
MLGHTEESRPLEAVTIQGTDEGASQVVVVLGGHPDEDTSWAGFRLLQYLATTTGGLAAHTVHVFLDSDPDGAALNAERGAESLRRYYEPMNRGGYHRPAVAEQPAMHLPLTAREDIPAGADMKATLALKQFLDDVLDGDGQPPILFDLHRCGIGKMYAITTEAQPPLERHFALAAAQAGLPLARESWALGDHLVSEWAPGVWKPAPAEVCTGDARMGNPQLYAKHRCPRARTVIVEVPQFTASGPLPLSGPHMARQLRNVDAALRLCARTLDDLTLTPHGRAYLSREHMLQHLASEEDRREWASGPFPLQTMLRQTSELTSHALCTRNLPSRNMSPEWTLHGRVVRFAQAVTGARPVAPAAAAHAVLATIAVALRGEQGLREVSR